MNCGNPISGHVHMTCNLNVGHPGPCAAAFDFGNTGRLADMKRVVAADDSRPMFNIRHPDPIFEAALTADAERLAELRAEYVVIRDLAYPTASQLARGRRVDSLIFVYEECAARGRTFGG